MSVWEGREKGWKISCERIAAPFHCIMRRGRKWFSKIHHFQQFSTPNNQIRCSWSIGEEKTEIQIIFDRKNRSDGAAKWTRFDSQNRHERERTRTSGYNFSAKVHFYEWFIESDGACLCSTTLKRTCFPNFGIFNGHFSSKAKSARKRSLQSLNIREKIRKMTWRLDEMGWTLA